MENLNIEAINFERDDNYCALSVTGRMTDDDVKALQERLENNAEDKGMTSLLVEMAEKDFDDLSAISAAFDRVRRIMRFTPALEKAAILSDSVFVRNSAKMAGATTPGLTVTAFEFDDAEYARRWLSDKQISDAVPSAKSPPESDKPEASNDWDGLDLSKVSA